MMKSRYCAARRVARAAASVGLMLVAASVHGADDDGGAALAEAKGCVACHGLDGVAVAPSYPNLDGQWERYLREQLRAYRAGKRRNEIMAGFAAALTDEEIRELARFYGD